MIKVKETPELKNLSDYQKRLELLTDTFATKNLSLEGKNVLLLDDLYRSGATFNAITRVLYEKGYKNVRVFCMGNECRNNIGNWETKHIAETRNRKENKKDFDPFFTEIA
ncbi:MAG: hypothetical protein NUV74_13600 [Candidatus Brocadiaceae bacterium]|nr:hypothetical protein [Candidatus Brocadiaceae bacterium]